ncbi:MAG: cysteine hydrolase, partial [Sphaerochaetaceae bacterium]|nr:cysteine hydrolase [Sphaerochaetaceae bacterium]
MIRILVVVDVQKDFVDGALGSERAYSKAVPAVVEKIKENRKNGDWLIFTLDTHAEDYLQTFEGRKLPVVHCVKGTEGWNLDERIRELPEETFREKCLFIEKPGFGSTELISEIKKISDGEDFELEFCGLCTDICV